MGTQHPESPSLDPFQGIPEMQPAPESGLQAQRGQQLVEAKVEAATPDKRWALPCYGYGSCTNKSVRYFVLGMTCLGNAVLP